MHINQPLASHATFMMDLSGGKSGLAEKIFDYLAKDAAGKNVLPHPLLADAMNDPALKERIELYRRLYSSDVQLGA